MKISILLPVYNEEDNIVPMVGEVLGVLKEKLPRYDYEILIIENCSTDDTRARVLTLCRENPKIKAIFNARNFGSLNSPFYGLLQTSGDCSILMSADFQDPVEMIPQFVAEWEKGHKIVIGVKTSSQENRIMYLLRSCYYKMIRKFSQVDQIEHYNGFGLYDKSFIDFLRELRDPTPYLRGIIAEYGYRRKDLPYRQSKRRSGKSSNNWFKLYDMAMLGFTSYTKFGLRLAVFLGFIFSGASLLLALIYLVLKLILWDSFPLGMAPLLIGLFVFCSLQLFFIGLLGEYIMHINSKVMYRPLVIEERRINFEDGKRPAGGSEQPERHGRDSFDL